MSHAIRKMRLVTVTNLILKAVSERKKLGMSLDPFWPGFELISTSLT